jgi:ribonucleoside-diphosphate reductase alpha chain
MSALTNNAIQILKARYLLRNENDELIETPQHMLQRVAKFVASCKIKIDRFGMSVFIN